MLFGGKRPGEKRIHLFTYLWKLLQHAPSSKKKNLHVSVSQHLPLYTYRKSLRTTHDDLFCSYQRCRKFEPVTAMLLRPVLSIHRPVKPLTHHVWINVFINCSFPCPGEFYVDADNVGYHGYRGASPEQRGSRLGLEFVLLLSNSCWSRSIE